MYLDIKLLLFDSAPAKRSITEFNTCCNHRAGPSHAITFKGIHKEKKIGRILKKGLKYESGKIRARDRVIRARLQEEMKERDGRRR